MSFRIRYSFDCGHIEGEEGYHAESPQRYKKIYPNLYTVDLVQ